MERYVAYGVFKPQEYQKKFKGTKDTLCIEIPSSHAYESKEKAKKELNQAYRFVSVDGDVLLAVYNGEKYDIVGKSMRITTLGQPFDFYNYNQFKALGGKIKEMPRLGEKKQVYEVNSTFKELFPTLTPESDPAYIDIGGYDILELTKDELSKLPVWMED